MTDRDWQWTAFAIPWNVFVHKQLGADDNFDIGSLLITTFLEIVIENNILASFGSRHFYQQF